MTKADLEREETGLKAETARVEAALRAEITASAARCAPIWRVDTGTAARAGPRCRKAQQQPVRAQFELWG